MSITVKNDNAAPPTCLRTCTNGQLFRFPSSGNTYMVISPPGHLAQAYTAYVNVATGMTFDAVDTTNVVKYEGTLNVKEQS